MKRFFQQIFSSCSRALFAAFPLRNRVALACALGALWAVCWLAAAAADNTVDLHGADLKPAAEELKTLRKENEQLKIENSLLRRENQQLRRLLMENAGSAQTAAALTSLGSTNPLAPRSEPGFSHWLSTSGKRHNSNCRYFQTAGGRPCGPQDGTACKICGG